MTAQADVDRATPTSTAHAAGLWHGAGETSINLTWDHVLDRAVKAYWQRRPPQPRKDAA